MTSSPQAYPQYFPEQLWFLCPRVHTVINPTRVTMPPEARPKLHYIYTHPFRKSPTGYDQRALTYLLMSLVSRWEVQEPADREYTFTLRYTELSWRDWAEMTVPGNTNPLVRSTLERWKYFAERRQIEVLDGYEVDIRDVAIGERV